jgi:hypothetical protein
MEEFQLENSEMAPREAPKQEDSAIRAKRLAELVRVRLKEKLAQSAGAEPFLYWLRLDGAKNA